MVYLITEKQLSLIKEKAFKEDYYIKLSPVIQRLDRFMNKLEKVVNYNLNKKKEELGDNLFKYGFDIIKKMGDGYDIRIGHEGGGDKGDFFVEISLKGRLIGLNRENSINDRVFLELSSTKKSQYHGYMQVRKDESDVYYTVRLNRVSLDKKFDGYHIYYDKNVLYHELVHLLDIIENKKHTRRSQSKSPKGFEREDYAAYRSTPTEYVAFLNDAFYDFIENVSITFKEPRNFENWVKMTFSYKLYYLDEKYRKKALKGIYGFYKDFRVKSNMYLLMNRINNPRYKNMITKGNRDLDMHLFAPGLNELMSNLNNPFIKNWFERNKNNILLILKHATENEQNCEVYRKGGDYNELMGYIGTDKDRDWCQELKDIYNKLK